MDKKLANMLLKIVRKSIVYFVKYGKELEIDVDKIDKLPNKLRELKGVFVSIYKNNELRGCIGFPYPIYPLVVAAIKAAKEACRDPRFEKLKEDELNKIKVEISILGEMRRIDHNLKNRREILNLLNENRGYMIVRNSTSGLFLPQVWKHVKNKKEFIENLCYKAGLDKDCWLDEKVKVYEFEVEIIKED